LGSGRGHDRTRSVTVTGSFAAYEPSPYSKGSEERGLPIRAGPQATRSTCSCWRPTSECPTTRARKSRLSSSGWMRLRNSVQIGDAVPGWMEARLCRVSDNPGRVPRVDPSGVTTPFAAFSSHGSASQLVCPHSKPGLNCPGGVKAGAIRDSLRLREEPGAVRWPTRAGSRPPPVANLGGTGTSGSGAAGPAGRCCPRPLALGRRPTAYRRLLGAPQRHWCDDQPWRRPRRLSSRSHSQSWLWQNEVG
jgi:hypothetical protein